jgi:hypothetical protein
MLGGGADAEASGLGNGAEAPSPQPKGSRMCTLQKGMNNSSSGQVSPTGSEHDSGSGSPVAACYCCDIGPVMRKKSSTELHLGTCPCALHPAGAAAGSTVQRE